MITITPELLKLVESDGQVKSAFNKFLIHKLEAETLAMKHRMHNMKNEFDRAKDGSDTEKETAEQIKPEGF